MMARVMMRNSNNNSDDDDHDLLIYLIEVVVVVVVGVVSYGVGTGVMVAAVRVAQKPRASARMIYKGPMFLSSSVVATGVISSSGGMSAPRWRKTTRSIQKKMMGELLEKKEIAYIGSRTGMEER